MLRKMFHWLWGYAWMPLIVVLAGIDYRRGELKGTWLIVICLMAAGSYLVLWAAERMVELRDK